VKEAIDLALEANDHLAEAIGVIQSYRAQKSGKNYLH